MKFPNFPDNQLIDFASSSDQMQNVNFYPSDIGLLDATHIILSDYEANFKKNLITQSEDWIYRTKSVNYTRNGQGYRCKPFNEIDWNNSIVILGCSHVFGTGVDDADTLSARLQEITGLNVVNLGVGGSCQQVSLYNMILLKFNNIKPKAIIHVWTESTRRFDVDNNYFLRPAGAWNNFGFPKDTPPSILKQMFYENNTHVVSAMFNRMIANSLYFDIPVIHATYFHHMWLQQHLKYPNLPMLNLQTIDLARDCKHPGIESHTLAAKLLHDVLIKSWSG